MRRCDAYLRCAVHRPREIGMHRTRKRLAAAMGLALWAGAAGAAECGPAAKQSWIGDWFRAWELVSREVLRLAPAPAPQLVFFDAHCVWTTSSVTAPRAEATAGPALQGEALSWRAAAHDGKAIVLPDGQAMPVMQTSFAAPDGRGGAFFVMAAPSYWKASGVTSAELGLERLVTAVFVHEFSHTRQIAAFGPRLDALERSWHGEGEVSDDLVQHVLGEEPDYAADFARERDLLFAAAAAAAPDAARARELAAQALEAMRLRRATWFDGERAVLGELDDAFLSFEGAGQLAGYRWLIHPQGGALAPEVALPGTRRGGRFWSQDEGLALYLVLDRLASDWPVRAYADDAEGALAQLEHALR